MKRESMWIGLLTMSALALGVALAICRTPPTARADMQAIGPRYTLLTASSGFGSVDTVNVLDNRDGLVLIYVLQGRRLVLQHVLNLNDQFSPPPLR